MFLPTISPHDPKIVIERCDMTGSYISLDGGGSWRMFNLRSGTSAFAFDPLRANVIYAAAGALWRSEDTGRTWSLILPDRRLRANLIQAEGVHGRADPADFRRRRKTRARGDDGCGRAHDGGRTMTTIRRAGG
jgi:hypothetical protein